MFDDDNDDDDDDDEDDDYIDDDIDDDVEGIPLQHDLFFFLFLTGSGYNVF